MIPLVLFIFLTSNIDTDSIYMVEHNFLVIWFIHLY